MFKKSVVGVVIAATAVLAATSAYAYWTASGAGSGQATTGTTARIAIVQRVPATGLGPDGSAVLSGNFNNPNPGPIHYSSITGRVRLFSVAPDQSKPPCTQDDFRVDGSSAPGVVPPGNRVGSWSGLSVRMVNRPDRNQDNCKNVTVPIRYVMNP